MFWNVYPRHWGKCHLVAYNAGAIGQTSPILCWCFFQKSKKSDYFLKAVHLMPCILVTPYEFCVSWFVLVSRFKLQPHTVITRSHTATLSFSKSSSTYNLRAAIAQSVYRLATGWKVRGSNPGGGRDFPHRPDRPWGPPSLLYNGHRVFPRGKAAGAWRPPTPSNAEGKERVEIYLYSPAGTLCPVLGWTLPLRQNQFREPHSLVSVGLLF